MKNTTNPPRQQPEHQIDFSNSAFFDGKIKPYTRTQDSEGHSRTYTVQFAQADMEYVDRIITWGLKHGMTWQRPHDFIRDAVHKYLLWCWHEWEPANPDAAVYFQAVAGMIEEDFERSRRREMDGVINNLLDLLVRRLHGAQKERSVPALENIVRELSALVRHIMLMQGHEPYYHSRWAMRLITDKRILPILGMIRSRPEFNTTPLAEKLEEWLATYGADDDAASSAI